MRTNPHLKSTAVIMPAELHAFLKHQAQECNMPLNRFVVTALVEQVRQHYPQCKLPDTFKCNTWRTSKGGQK